MYIFLKVNKLFCCLPKIDLWQYSKYVEYNEIKIMKI